MFIAALNADWITNKKPPAQTYRIESVCFAVSKYYGTAADVLGLMSAKATRANIALKDAMGTTRQQ
jgi:hypothetical protein